MPSLFRSTLVTIIVGGAAKVTRPAHWTGADCWRGADKHTPTQELPQRSLWEREPRDSPLALEGCTPPLALVQ